MTIAYAWGSLEDHNLKLATQTIRADSGPGGVHAGEAGLVASGALPGVLAALVVGLVGASWCVASARPAGAPGRRADRDRIPQ